jgi:preprotein translocase subunit YajC
MLALFADAEAPTKPETTTTATGTGAGAGAGMDFCGGGGLTTMLPLLLGLFVLYYFFILRPQGKVEAERRKLLSIIKKGDDVITNAGIYGQVVSVSETEDECVIKVDEGTRLRIMKSVIIRNLTGEKALKEQQEKK